MILFWSVYIIKHMLWIFTSEWHFYYYFCGKSNCFKYSFLTIHSFCFVVIAATVVQSYLYERKCKNKITVKNPLASNCNTMVDPVKKIFQLDQYFLWIYSKQGIISIFFLWYFILECASWFSLLSYMIQCHILRKFKPIILLWWGCNFIFKLIRRKFITNEVKFVLQWK